jgi:hypothetical protein
LGSNPVIQVGALLLPPRSVRSISSGMEPREISGVPWAAVDKGRGNVSQASPTCADKGCVSPLGDPLEAMAVVQAIPLDQQLAYLSAIGRSSVVSRGEVTIRPTSLRSWPNAKSICRKFPPFSRRVITRRVYVNTYASAGVFELSRSSKHQLLYALAGLSAIAFIHKPFTKRGLLSQLSKVLDE